MCTKKSSVADGSCSGSGCCQLEIPKGLTNLRLAVGELLNYTEIPKLSHCGYAFIIEAERFRFLSSYIDKFEEEKVVVVLSWGIRNELKFECGSNTARISIFNGTQYGCQCLDGYEGNPYLRHGCQDVNECKYGWPNDCKYKDKCSNTEGNYTCGCPKNFHGDGRKGGEGCTKNSTSSIPIIIDNPQIKMGCCISKCKPKTIKRQPRFDLNNLVRHKLAVIPQPPPLTSAAPPPLSLNNKISPYPPSPSSISSSTTTITSFSPSTSRSLIFSADYLGSSYKHNAPLLRVNSLKPNPFSSPMKPVSPVIRHFPQQPSPQRVSRSTTLKRARPSPPSPVRQKSLRKEEDLLRRRQVGG
ncbi:Wall-associated receptor kinase 2, partial [Cucurbita argyrosperma subsp. sororia]